MSNTVIRVENLGKKYIIRHQKQQPYTALRDVIAEKIKSLRKNLLKPFEKKGFASIHEEFWALKDISFEIKQGDVVGIIGRNGAGKSTLLKILSRITEPTEGFASIRGRVASLLEVGTGFHPELTGRENIYLNGAILGMSKAEIKNKFDEIVAFAEVEKFLDTPVKHYSSGMYVRLAFAVAAHLEPEILLVDEVLAVGDYEFQKKCLGKMKNVSEGGRTVFFVSHNMGSISNLCSQAIWIDAGRLVSLGNTREIVSQYISSRSDASGQISWSDITTAPGNENVRLKSIAIVSDGMITANVRIDKPILIEIEYWNLKEGNLLNSALELRDKNNAFVLASNNRNSANLLIDEWYEKPRPKGLFKTICIIPANFLNDDYYSIDIAVEQRNYREVNVESAISFVVHETGEMRKEYTGNWLGAVRPKLAWSTEYLEKNSLEEVAESSID